MECGNAGASKRVFHTFFCSWCGGVGNFPVFWFVFSSNARIIRPRGKKMNETILRRICCLEFKGAAVQQVHLKGRSGSLPPGHEYTIWKPLNPGFEWNFPVVLKCRRRHSGHFVVVKHNANASSPDQVDVISTLYKQSVAYLYTSHGKISKLALAWPPNEYNSYIHSLSSVFGLYQLKRKIFDYLGKWILFIYLFIFAFLLKAAFAKAFCSSTEQWGCRLEKQNKKRMRQKRSVLL